MPRTPWLFTQPLPFRSGFGSMGIKFYFDRFRGFVRSWLPPPFADGFFRCLYQYWMPAPYNDGLYGPIWRNQRVHPYRPF
jgi:hypothetical protein